MSIDHRNVVPIRTAAIVSGYPSPMRVITPYYPRGSITDEDVIPQAWLGERSVKETLAGRTFLRSIISALPGT